VDILAWLRELGLERYEQAFRENEIAADILPKLTADDLKDIGVTIVGHRGSSWKRSPPWPSPLWRGKRDQASRSRS
jgi:SAM domain (Sterile alpha motif)